MKPTRILGFAACLFLIGCNDSKNPLSDPTTSKTDEQLIGVWRGKNGDSFTDYRISPAGERFPDGILRIVADRQSPGKAQSAEEYLAFPTVLEGKTYLNLVADPAQIKRLNDTGWKADTVAYYTLVWYRVDGDKLTVWVIDEDAKERAIKSGKIKGEAGHWNTVAQFTDTTENVARLIAEAGDSLWDLKEPGQFERVNPDKKR